LAASSLGRSMLRPLLRSEVSCCACIQLLQLLQQNAANTLQSPC
jgi:hypothetical protein